MLNYGGSNFLNYAWYLLHVTHVLLTLCAPSCFINCVLILKLSHVMMAPRVISTQHQADSGRSVSCDWDPEGQLSELTSDNYHFD